MAMTPEERRRESAEQPIPQRAGGGQMGQQKSSGGDTDQPQEARGHQDPGRDVKADEPADPGKRVVPETGHRGAIRPEDVDPGVGRDFKRD